MRRKSAELEEQNREILAASRLKNEFLANMSHELRTPLNGIIGFAELMHDGKVGAVSEPHREYLGDILASSYHLLQLISDVLDLAKIEAGRLELRLEHVDLPALAREVTEVLRGVAAKNRVVIRTHIDASLRAACTDASKVKQILYNYLSNAIKFTDRGGSIDVTLARDGGERFRLAVEDTGIGVRAEDLGKLFSEFQQLDSGSSKRYAGTGLGLALTKRFAEALGGEVGVESQVGKGSTFYALLPLESPELSHGR
jgi:signal transduction histidine kinase